VKSKKWRRKCRKNNFSTLGFQPFTFYFSLILYNDLFFVFAEDGAHLVGDLLLRGAHLDGFQDRRHEVTVDGQEKVCFRVKNDSIQKKDDGIVLLENTKSHSTAESLTMLSRSKTIQSGEERTDGLVQVLWEFSVQEFA
jgi:hypothetical protein